MPLSLPDFGRDAQRHGPSLGPVYAIHRAPDGYVSFSRKPAGEWEELGAVNLAQPFLPELVTHLTEDSYFGLNSSFRTGARLVTQHEWQQIPGEQPGAQQQVARTVRQRTIRATGLPYAAHSLSNLRWLNVCHVDLDCYKVGLTVGKALGVVIDLQDAGRLPPVTAFARSGRGLWLLWFLVDGMNPASGTAEVHGVLHKPDTPQRASKGALAYYAKVQCELVQRLAHLGADMGALDAARYAPVPGTMKTAAGKRADYWVQLDGRGQTFGYTLKGIGAALDVPDTPRPPVIAAALSDTPPNPTKSAAGKKGWKTRWQHALADFIVLVNLRGGGFKDGNSRHRGAFFYALLLHRSGMAWSDVAVELHQFAARCSPPLTASEVRAAIRQADKPAGGGAGFLSNGRIVAELHVTDVELSYLEFLVPKPKALAPTKEAGQGRHQAIRRIVAEQRRVPSPREMARLLEPLGLGGNYTTIWRDYKTLGLNVPRQESKGGRPPNLPYV